jgi:hypothetical protein
MDDKKEGSWLDVAIEAELQKQAELSRARREAEERRRLDEFRSALEAPCRELTNQVRPPSLVGHALSSAVDAVGQFCQAMVRLAEPEAAQLELVANRAAGAKVRGKPGPKKDIALARQCADIVRHMAGAEHWKTKLDDICDELDAAKFPIPKTWRRRETPIRSWTGAAATEPGLAKKAISHHLKNAGT